MSTPSQVLVQAEGSKKAVGKDRCPVPEAQSLVSRPQVLVCSLSNMPKLCPGPEEQPLPPAPGAKLCSCCHRVLACPTIWVSWPSLSRTGVTKGPKYKSTQFLSLDLCFLTLLNKLLSLTVILQLHPPKSEALRFVPLLTSVGTRACTWRGQGRMSVTFFRHFLPCSHRTGSSLFWLGLLVSKFSSSTCPFNAGVGHAWLFTWW